MQFSQKLCSAQGAIQALRTAGEDIYVGLGLPSGLQDATTLLHELQGLSKRPRSNALGFVTHTVGVTAKLKQRQVQDILCKHCPML